MQRFAPTARLDDLCNVPFRCLEECGMHGEEGMPPSPCLEVMVKRTHKNVTQLEPKHPEITAFLPKPNDGDELAKPGSRC